jgi:serine/threonine protein kinase
MPDSKETRQGEPIFPDSLPLESIGHVTNPSQSFDPQRSTLLEKRSDLSIRHEQTERFHRRAGTKWTVLKVATPGIDAVDETDPMRQDYVLHTQIGTGGFGEVWQARQVSLGRLVAVKYMRRDLFEERKENESRGRALDMSFRQEALATANLEHPNIVPVHEVGIDQDGRPLIAMKLIRGRVWQDIIEEDFYLLSFGEYIAKHLPILIDVAQAVAFAHSRGVIHRDIKPAQVMVGEFGEVVLMDWGLAVQFDPSRLAEVNSLGGSLNLPTLADATNPAGTLAYMAPEQTAKTASRLGPHTDIYLLGGLLYFLLTNTTPHDPDSVVTAFKQAKAGEMRPLLTTRRGSEIPYSLLMIVTRALAPLPEDRHESAREFIAELQQYLAGAGKRQESILITDEVRNDLEQPNLGYAEYSHFLAEVAKARVLYPENPDAGPLEEQLHIRYARQALANGDYTLARLQATQVIDAEVREEILDKADMAESSIRQQQAHQRLLRGLAFLLFFAQLWVGGAFLDVINDRERMDGRMTLLFEREKQLVELSRAINGMIPELEAPPTTAGPLVVPASRITPAFETALGQYLTTAGTMIDLALAGPNIPERRESKIAQIDIARDHLAALRDTLGPRGRTERGDFIELADPRTISEQTPAGTAETALVAWREMPAVFDAIVRTVRTENNLEDERLKLLVRRGRFATVTLAITFFLILLLIYTTSRRRLPGRR